MVNELNNLNYTFRENKLNDRTKERINEIYQEKIYSLQNELSKCESPIEEILGLELFTQIKSSYGGSFYTCEIIPQYQVELEGNRYRVDFLIKVMHRGEVVKLVVECDGHDYHERTKEQAKNDRSRDRAFMRNGYCVIRFTGSEINEDSQSCGIEAMHTIYAELDKLINFEKLRLEADSYE